MSTVEICALCGGRNLEEVLVKKGYHLARCNDCGLIFVTNPPDDLRKLYSPKGKYQMQYRRDQKARELFMDHCHRQFDFFKKFGGHGSVLDVGCSIGGFLSLCDGHERVGLEINSATRGVAKQYFGLEVYGCTLAEFHRRYSGRRFDCVTLWDVIEHLPDPNCTLSVVCKILKPGGLLFIETSNADGLFARLSFILRNRFRWYHPQPPYHLFQYGVRTLVQMLKKYQFEVTEMVTFPASYQRKRSTVKGRAYLSLFGPVDLLSHWLGDGDMVTLVARRSR